MPWTRRRYRSNKVWVQVSDRGAVMLDERGFASIRYKQDDKRTYSVRLSELKPLADDLPQREIVRAYTDGACKGNPGPAGWGVLLLWRDHRRELSGALGHSTSNVAELTAVEQALGALKRKDLPVRIYTDSSYAISVLSKGARAKANRALVDRIRAALRAFDDVSFVKVRGHAGVRGNERADRLARRGIHAPA